MKSKRDTVCTEWDIRSGRVRPVVVRWRSRGLTRAAASFSSLVLHPTCVTLRPALPSRSLRPSLTLFILPIAPFVFFRRFDRLFSNVGFVRRPDVATNERTMRLSTYLRCIYGVFTKEDGRKNRGRPLEAEGDKLDMLFPSGETSSRRSHRFPLVSLRATPPRSRDFNAIEKTTERIDR